MITEMLFTTRQLLDATQIPAERFQSWTTRGVIVGAGGDIDAAGRRGVRRRFTWHQVMHVATAVAFMEAGLDASEAFKAAVPFAHAGDQLRQPGLPFPDGKTLICAAGGRSVVVHWKDGEGESALGRIEYGLSGPFGSSPTGYVTVNASAVFDRLCGLINEHPEAALADCYSSQPEPASERWRPATK